MPVAHRRLERQRQRELALLVIFEPRAVVGQGELAESLLLGCVARQVPWQKEPARVAVCPPAARCDRARTRRSQTVAGFPLSMYLPPRTGARPHAPDRESTCDVGPGRVRPQVPAAPRFPAGPPPQLCQPAQRCSIDSRQPCLASLCSILVQRATAVPPESAAGPTGSLAGVPGSGIGRCARSPSIHRRGHRAHAPLPPAAGVLHRPARKRQPTTQ